MNFSSTQENIFKNNLKALENTELKESLLKITGTKFELLLGTDSLDINLKNSTGGGGFAVSKCFKRA